jgi:hypothetical protein
MKGQKTPSRKRWAKCPKCGLYFAPAGLEGHKRFYHKMGIGQKKQDPAEEMYEVTRTKNRMQLMNLAGKYGRSKDPSLRRQLVDDALYNLAIDYIFGFGIFKEK